MSAGPQDVPFRQAGVSGEPPGIRGWLRLSNSYLDKLKPREDLTEYFDGATPDWRDVLNPHMRPREAVDTVLERLLPAVSTGRSVLQLVRGASGEGKSTVLRQSAVSLVRDGHFDAVYWRQSLNVGLPSELDELLGRFQTVLFVADSGESLLKGLDEFVANLNGDDEEGRAHFLLASRDTDWSYQCRLLNWHVDPLGRWSDILSIPATVDLGGLNREDALIVAENWLACAPELPTPVAGRNQAQVASVLRRESHAEVGEGSLLGALLKTRFTDDQLRSRLGRLLERTAEGLIGNDRSLADLLVAIAAVDIADLPGLPKEICARYFGMHESELRPKVEVPLRREFVLGETSEMFHARHPLVSRATLSVALAENSMVPAEDAVVSVLASLSEIVQEHPFRPGYGRIVELGRRLGLAEHNEVEKRDLPTIVCRAACKLFPDKLANVINLSQRLRETGRAEGALSEVWLRASNFLDKRDSWQDYRDHARGAWQEWAAALGSSEMNKEAYWAGIVSLSRRCKVPLYARDMGRGLHQSAMSIYKIIRSNGGHAILPTTLALIKWAMETFFPDDELGNQYVHRYAAEVGVTDISEGNIEQLIGALLDSFAAFEVDGFERQIERLRSAEDLDLDLLARELTKLRSQ